MQLDYDPIDVQKIQSQFIFNETKFEPFIGLWHLSPDKSYFYSNPLKRDQLILKDSKLIMKQIGHQRQNGRVLPRYKLFIASIGE